METDPPLFLFGMLRHAPLLAVVTGEAALSGEPAFAPGREAVHALGADGAERAFPVLAARPDARAEGVLIRPDATARARLDAYARAFGLVPLPITVRRQAGAVEALHYAPESGGWGEGSAWSLPQWVAARAGLAVAVAEALMAELPALTPAVAAHRRPMLERRVASRLRAQAQPAPASQRRSPGPGDVALSRLERPHAGFFALEVADLRFCRFDGSPSPKVRREGFVVADAVTVLPYDPRADLVLLVEQFRFGPYLRGDPNPWMLEPVAGYVDAGETPEEGARREAREEAGLEMGALHFAAGYYPSPGAVSEYAHSYIGLAELAGHGGGLGGLEAEAEDIRAHVLPFERLMELVASGEAATGPLLVSAFWLAANRARLRGSAGV